LEVVKIYGPYKRKKDKTVFYKILYNNGKLGTVEEQKISTGYKRWTSEESEDDTFSLKNHDLQRIIKNTSKSNKRAVIRAFRACFMEELINSGKFPMKGICTVFMAYAIKFRKNRPRGLKLTPVIGGFRKKSHNKKVRSIWKWLE